MGLWVRSQNKTELMRVVDLDIYDAGEPKTYVIESRGILLGTYKTKERALEVLDEIQNILKPVIINKQIKSDGMLADGLSDGVLHTYNVNEIKELSTYVYEMPEE